MICPNCEGWGFDSDGQDCQKCEGIGELPDIPPEPPVPDPAPPPFDPEQEGDIDAADWWKQGADTDGDDQNKEGD